MALKRSITPLDAHLSAAAEAGHPVTLAQVVEARLGQLCGGDDGKRPGVEGVQTVLLPAHAWVVARRSLMGHVLYTPRAQGTGGWQSREGRVQETNRILDLAYWRVGSRKLEEKENDGSLKQHPLSQPTPLSYESCPLLSRQSYR